jgi:predicted carbohydrate-binding protein with CBM5 and CBM33 domain
MGLFNDAGEAFNQVTDTIGDGAAEVVSVSGDAFNQYTDTIGDASEFGEQLVSDAGEAFNQVTDTIGDVPGIVVSDAGEAFNQVTDTIGDGAAQLVSGGGDAVNQAAETVNNFLPEDFLPEDIGKNLGLALYGILAVAGIILFLYTLSLLKPVFEIGSNVT